MIYIVLTTVRLYLAFSPPPPPDIRKESSVRVECKDNMVGERTSTRVLSITPSSSSPPPPPDTAGGDGYLAAGDKIVEDVVHFREPRIYDVTLSKCGGSVFKRRATSPAPSPVLPPAPPPELEEKVRGVGGIWGEYVGNGVMKPFNDELFSGEVVQHLGGEEGGLWRVRYEDGDEEDMELPELVAAMELHKRGGIVPYKGVEEGLRILMEEEDADEEDPNPATATPITGRRNNNDTDITFEPSTSLLTTSETPVRRSNFNNDTTLASALDASTAGRSTPAMGEGRVYFRRSVVEFGEKQVGTCGSIRLQLCNSTKKEVVVRVSEVRN